MGKAQVTHADLVKVAENWLVSNYGAWAVREPQGRKRGRGERPDVFALDDFMASYVIDAKVSQADANAQRKKPWQGIGEYHWLLCAEKYDRVIVPDGWGLLWMDGRAVCGNRHEAERQARDIRMEMAMVVNTCRDYERATGRTPDDVRPGKRCDLTAEEQGKVRDALEVGGPMSAALIRRVCMFKHLSATVLSNKLQDMDGVAHRKGDGTGAFEFYLEGVA